MTANNTINGKTPEEIKNGLFACKRNGDCDRGNCPYHIFDSGTKCIPAMCADAHAYIQQLEVERDEARDDLDTLSYANTELHSAYEAMKRERDASVEDMTELMQLAQFCRHCKHLTEDGECTFDFVANKDEPWCWQWRGVQNDG